MTQREIALQKAWESIQEYCKKYKGLSTQDVQFEWQHEVYVWQEFGVTPNGEAYFVRGGHDKSRRSNNADWYYHPNHNEGYVFAKYPCIEDIVKHWNVIKTMLEKKFQTDKNREILYLCKDNVIESACTCWLCNAMMKLQKFTI